MEAVIQGWTIPAVVERYAQGECRDRIFRDLIFADTRPHGRKKTFLDIGCGRGFDGDIPLQASIADVAGTFIGVEPDTAVTAGAYFDQVHRSFFEQAPIEDESVDVAYAIMVLEHLADPQPFWDKVWRVLRKGGVFWGLTVDRRHWFCQCSLLLEKLRLKELYLNFLLGRRGSERYENYPVYYRSNSPAQVRRYTGQFAKRHFVNFSRAGQCAEYFPGAVQALYGRLDQRLHRGDRIGTLLALRVEK